MVRVGGPIVAVAVRVGMAVRIVGFGQVWVLLRLGWDVDDIGRMEVVGRVLVSSER